MSWLDSISDLIDKSLNELRELVMDGGAWSAAVHGFSELHATEGLSGTD